MSRELALALASLRFIVEMLSLSLRSGAFGPSHPLLARVPAVSVLPKISILSARFGVLPILTPLRSFCLACCPFSADANQTSTVPFAPSFEVVLVDAFNR